MIVKISYHTVIRGKPEFRKECGKLSVYQDGKKTNLGYHWKNIDASWDDIFELITVDGIATSAALNGDHRCDAEFESRQLIMVDIDKDMTLYDLFENDFYNNYGAGFYTTPSHTDDHHRFRLMFRLEKPIDNAVDMKKLHEFFLTEYPYADKSCKDASRIFFGTVGCKLKEKRNNIISEDDTLALLSTIKDVIQPVANIHLEISESEVILHLDNLRKHYNELEYHFRRDITWAVRSALSDSETIAVMRARWPDQTDNGKYEMMIKSYQPNKIGMGTIIHWIRQKDPSYLKRKEPTIYNNLTASDAILMQYRNRKN